MIRLNLRDGITVLPCRGFAALASSLPLLFLSWHPGSAVAQQRDAPTTLAGEPIAHFDVYSDGDTIHLLTGHGRKGEPVIALYHRRSSDAGANWSRPVRVNRDQDRLSARHPGENPQVAAIGERVIVAWTAVRAAPIAHPPGAHGVNMHPDVRGGQHESHSHAKAAPATGGAAGHGAGAGPITTMLSDDGGNSWRAGPVPFPDAPGGQTFMEMRGAGNTLHMVWLDGRNGGQSLRYAQSRDRGTSWSADRAVAPRTCDCCWNSLAVSSEGAVSVLYRGAVPRDIMHAVSVGDSAWRHTGSVGGFNWRQQVCPHVGGALAQSGTALHALVWTGKESVSGLYYSGSTDSGATWGVPRRLGSGNARHADLAAAPDGALVAVWDEPDGPAASLQMSRSVDRGATWPAPQRIAAGPSATLPRVMVTRQGVTIFWIEGSPWKGGVLKINGRTLSGPVTAAAG